jgi:hypothetical protein
MEVKTLVQFERSTDAQIEEIYRLETRGQPKTARTQDSKRAQLRETRSQGNGAVRRLEKPKLLQDKCYSV